jgi:hypothetical protein
VGYVLLQAWRRTRSIAFALLLIIGIGAIIGYLFAPERDSDAYWIGRPPLEVVDDAANHRGSFKYSYEYYKFQKDQRERKNRQPLEKDDPRRLTGGLVALFLLFTAWLTAYCFVAYELRHSYISSRECRGARAFLDEQDQSDRPFCLLLRPFGADHAITFGLPGQQKTLEETLDHMLRSEFDCPAVALVDPRLSLVPASVTYLVADDASWWDAVDSLVSKARVVVLVIPRGTRIGASVRWEVECVMRHELSNRFIVALGSPGGFGYWKTVEQWQVVGDVFPAFASAPFGTIAAHWSATGEAEFYGHQDLRPKWLRWLPLEFTEAGYTAALRAALTRATAAARSVSVS